MKKRNIDLKQKSECMNYDFVEINKDMFIIMTIRENY